MSSPVAHKRRAWPMLSPRLVFVTVFVFAGCGGGGESSTTPPPPVPPSVSVQPQSQTVSAPAPATFSVTASGTAPLSYQWNKNGTAISGATSATYTTPATTSADNGAKFTVAVTDSAGSVNSNSATLTVNVPPSITQDRIYDPLPQPLRLPPDMVETLPLNATGSFFGDAFRVVDCQDDSDLPLGSCGNLLFGGLVMFDAQLSGNLRIQFYPPVKNIAHFEVTHGELLGNQGIAQSPQGYMLVPKKARVTDVPDRICEGALNLITGEVSNLNYQVVFDVSGIDAIHNVNPNFATQPTVEFPGPLGHVWIKFEQRPDGLLDYSFQGTTFAPFGKDIQGDLVRFPTPVCDAQYNCASLLARGTSAHPHLYLSTKEPEGPECGLNCADIPANSIEDFTLFTYSSSMGDDFNLDNPAFGGVGLARTNLQGRMRIQFGPRVGDIVYFVITPNVPEGLLAEPPPSPLPIPGFLPSLIGQEEVVRFPKLTYRVQRFAVVGDPYNFPQGAINLKTGQIVGEMAFPAILTANIPEAIFNLNFGRIPFPFQLIARHQPGLAPAPTYALFEKGSNGQTLFRFSGDLKMTFGTFFFPSPDFNNANSLTTGPNASLNIYLRLQAIRTTDQPRTRKTGGATNVVSSVGDSFSYSYSMSCNPADKNFSFDYTNRNPGQFGGAFRLTRLAALKCMNSRTSILPSGDYDTITFSGFGTWSKDDPDSAPRFATVQISTSLDFPYVGILVYQNPDRQNNVIISSAHTRPANIPLP